MYDVVIVGGGPAGISAAIYGKRAGLQTLLIERMPISGGQILNTYDVDNYPGIPGISGLELGQKFKEHADQFEVESRTGEVGAIRDLGSYKVVALNTEEIETKTVILATGAHYRKLGVYGEQELEGMGVSYCATCDGAFFKNRTVAVVGGGDVALEDAIFLARGCKKVYLIHRRDEFRGAAILVDRVCKTDNIEILYDTEVRSILGEDQVEQIVIYNKKKQEENKLEVSGVFLAVGIEPDSVLVRGMAELDHTGYVVAGEDCQTSCAGLYVAGDVRTKQLRQVITAAADGANAITSVERYLNEN